MSEIVSARDAKIPWNNGRDFGWCHLQTEPRQVASYDTSENYLPSEDFPRDKQLGLLHQRFLNALTSMLLVSWTRSPQNGGTSWYLSIS